METTLECSTGNFQPGLTDKSGVIAATDTGTSEGSPALALSLNGAHGVTRPTLQPITDVAEYLAARRPCLTPGRENELFITLPAAERENVTELLAAFERVNDRRKSMSVSRACAEVLAQGRFSRRVWNAKTFRALFDAYTRTKDWVCLVNRSRCVAGWRKTSVGLPTAFLNFCAQRFAEFKREDGKRQAVMAIKRQWRTGRTPAGEAEVIPGYEPGWEQRNREVFPVGWHYSNILRQIKKHGLLTPAVRAMLHEGNAAASQQLPQILSTRRGLRFLEVVTFDDVRTDWLVFDPKTGQAVELWLLVARCLGTALVLGFVMHPAVVREDGRATHLGLAQMKQLAGWMLERYPLPPYVSTWRIERGTASLSEGMRLALGELFGNRIAVSFTSMLGGNSPAGYRERAKGNSRGKASHESHNRLFHTQGAFIAGQTGNRWDIRPADLQSRADEAVEIWEMTQRLPMHLRGQEKYPLLTLNQAREHLFRICNEQNEREDHALEDFEEVLTRRADGQIVKRMEKPIERAARLSMGYEWTPVSPHIIQTFYESNEKSLVVNAKGEIEFQHDGRSFVYQHAGVPLSPGTKALGYFHPDDPRFLHLTNGKGSFFGTWLRRERVAGINSEALAAAFRYTAQAKAVAEQAARALAAPERADLDAMRAHNEELMKLAEFTDITEAPQANAGTVGSPIGAALIAVSETAKADVKKANRKATAEEREASQAAASDLLKVFKSVAKTGE